jgi:hypothetical protein
MPTGPHDRNRPSEYQKVFRRAPTASSSDVHDETKVPVTTDVKTLELFARALQSFAASNTQMTHSERRRYRLSTAGLSLLASALLAVVGMLVSNIVGRETERPVVEDDVAEKIDNVDAQLRDVKVQTASKCEELVVLRRQRDALARLQVEQNDYLVTLLTAVAGSHKRVPDKPRSLVEAEAAVLATESRR